jgi:hypothetical protein
LRCESGIIAGQTGDFGLEFFNASGERCLLVLRVGLHRLKAADHSGMLRRNPSLIAKLGAKPAHVLYGRAKSFCRLRFRTGNTAPRWSRFDDFFHVKFLWLRDPTGRAEPS